MNEVLITITLLKMNYTIKNEKPFADDSSDLGSLVIKESQGLCDGDLAYIADLEPNHSFIIHEERGMMININEAEHVGDRALMSGSQANPGSAVSLRRP